MPEVYLAQLIAECQAECEATVVGIQKGEYTEAVKNAYQEAIDKAKAATAEQAEQAIGELTAARDTYLNSANTVDRTALGKALTTADNAVKAAVAGDCDGQYPADAIDSYTSVIANVRKVYDDVEQDQAAVDEALSQLNEATTLFNTHKVTIDFAELKSIIAIAKSALTSAESEKGEGAGKYPVSAFDILQAAIDKASAIVGSKTVNQTAVNAECEALDDAIATFAMARVPNDYTALQELVDEITALLAAVKNGEYEYEQEDYDDMQASLEKNAALLNSTNQDDIDRAVKLLKRDLALFKSLITATAIEAVAATQWTFTMNDRVLTVSALPEQATIAVYTIQGEIVATTKQATLSPGIYLIQVAYDGKAETRKIWVK